MVSSALYKKIEVKLFLTGCNIELERKKGAMSLHALAERRNVSCGCRGKKFKGYIFFAIERNLQMGLGQFGCVWR